MPVLTRQLQLDFEERLWSKLATRFRTHAGFRDDDMRREFHTAFVQALDSVL